MSKAGTFFLILMRVSVGWFFLYQGIIELLNSKWSLLPMIKDAQLFSVFYKTLSEPTLLPYLNYGIKGLFIIVGLLLVVGLLVRSASIVGVLLMLLFYFPLLHGPYIGSLYYIVDEHFIIVVVLLYLFVMRAGEYFSLGTMFRFSRH